MKKSPESFIPSIKDKDVKQWLKEEGPYWGQAERRQETRWVTEGQHGYQVEIENNFGPELLQFASERMLEGGGKLKIVSFGGGKLYFLVELYSKLEEIAKENNKKADIEILDYSLSKTLSGMIDEKDNQDLVDKREELLQSGLIRVKPGLLQVRDVSSAEGADIMISRQGPFYHADSVQEIREMIKKVTEKLAVGGKAYFDTSLPETGEDRYAEAGFDLRRFKAYLGEDFDIVVRPKIDYRTRNWIEITRVGGQASKSVQGLE